MLCVHRTKVHLCFCMKANVTEVMGYSEKISKLNVMVRS